MPENTSLFKHFSAFCRCGLWPPSQHTNLQKHRLENTVCYSLGWGVSLYSLGKGRAGQGSVFQLVRIVLKHCDCWEEEGQPTNPHQLVMKQKVSKGKHKPAQAQAALRRRRRRRNPEGMFSSAQPRIRDCKSLAIAKNHPKPSQELSEWCGPFVHKMKGFGRNSPQKVHANFTPKTWEDKFFQRLRDDKKIKFALFRGVGRGGREENCPKMLFFLGNASRQ